MGGAYGQVGTRAYPTGTTPLYQHLSSAGDGTGTVSFVGDYTTPANAYIAPGAGEQYAIYRIIVMIQDGGGMRAERFAGLAAPLTNGVLVEKRHTFASPVVVAQYHGAVPVTHNADWGRLAGVDVDIKTWGAGDDVLVARFSFDKAGHPVYLNGDAGEYLTVYLQDDLTGLVDFYIMAQGFIL